MRGCAWVLLGIWPALLYSQRLSPYKIATLDEISATGDITTSKKLSAYGGASLEGAVSINEGSSSVTRMNAGAGSGDLVIGGAKEQTLSIGESPYPKVVRICSTPLSSGIGEEYLYLGAGGIQADRLDKHILLGSTLADSIVDGSCNIKAAEAPTTGVGAQLTRIGCGNQGSSRFTRTEVANGICTKGQHITAIACGERTGGTKKIQIGANAGTQSIQLGGPNTTLTIQGKITKGSKGQTIKYDTATKQWIRKTSSLRYKENIGPMGDSSWLHELQGKSFNYIGDSEQCYGWIAEEVESIFPGLVTYDPDGLPDGIDYQEAIPFMVEEIKGLRVEVDEQKKAIADLRQELEELKKRILV